MNEKRKAFEEWARKDYGLQDDDLKIVHEDRYFWVTTTDMWLAWQAAIASQAPRQALSDAEIIQALEPHIDRFPSTKVGEESFWITKPELIAFVRAIEAASGPNAALVEALKAMVADFDGCYAEAEPAMIKARAALAAVGEEP